MWWILLIGLGALALGRGVAQRPHFVNRQSGAFVVLPGGKSIALAWTSAKSGAVITSYGTADSMGYYEVPDASGQSTHFIPGTPDVLVFPNGKQQRLTWHDPKASDFKPYSPPGAGDNTSDSYAD